MFNWRTAWSATSLNVIAKWILESPINEAKNAGAANTPVGAKPLALLSTLNLRIPSNTASNAVASLV